MRWENSQDTDFQGRRTACKAVYAGSIPTLASNKPPLSTRNFPGKTRECAANSPLNIGRKRARLGSFGLVRVAKTTRFRHTFR